MQPNGACVEYGHAYLKELVEGREPPDLSTVERELTKFADPTTLVIIDDTGTDTGIERGDDFEAIRDHYAAEYVKSLSIQPDVVLYESDFTEAIDELLRAIPYVESDDLTPELDIGLYKSSSNGGLYVYSGNGESVEKTRVRDYENPSKVTGFTCGAYDAAITLCKLGILTPPDPAIIGEEAVTFHPEYYLESVPFDRSRKFQTFLKRSGLVEYPDTAVANVALTASEVQTATGGS